MVRYKEKIERLFPEVVSWRRFLHQRPEVSFHEKKTSEFVAHKLQAWGIKVQKHVGGYGVVGVIEGEHPGPTVALRADMDALPIQDQKSVDYASEVPGVMHACRNDAHTATLLGVAKLLSDHRSELHGCVRLICQHAEEVLPGGHQSMIEAGALEGVDVIYGVHLWTPLAVGKVASVTGPIMAAVDDFQIEIQGKGGHAGLPHETSDSIVIASHLIVQLQTIISRFTNPVLPSVITVGSIHAGSSHNIIAEKCIIEGTVRTFDSSLRAEIQERIETLLHHTCTMFGAKGIIQYTNCYPTVVNHSEAVAQFHHTAAHLFGIEQVETSPLIMAAEDFSYYLNKIPGCF